MSATLAPLPWQDALWNTVKSARARGAFHHAWLLAGPEGVGKRHFAAMLSASLLCSNPHSSGLACGECKSCKMLSHGGHPDAHLLSLNGHIGLASTETLAIDNALSFWQPKPTSMRRDIAVDAARSLMEKLNTIAHLGGHRMVVIAPASEMSEATANALLKTIEEPPANTTLLFITEFPQSLKMTIRSRCQILRFGIPPRGGALTWLYKQDDAADASALDLAGGAPLKALSWLKDGHLAKQARWSQLLADVAAKKLDPLTAAFELSREKTEVGEMLRYWQAEISRKLRAHPTEWSQRHESFWALLLENLKRLEDTNANPQLVLESLLLRWRVLS